jgi:hypothetical protein
MPKKKLTLTINEELLTTARSQEINLSSFLEIRLADYEINDRHDENDSLKKVIFLIDRNFHNQHFHITVL